MSERASERCKRGHRFRATVPDLWDQRALVIRQPEDPNPTQKKEKKKRGKKKEKKGRDDKRQSVESTVRSTVESSSFYLSGVPRAKGNLGALERVRKRTLGHPNANPPGV